MSELIGQSDISANGQSRVNGTLRIRCADAPDEVPPAYFLPPPEYHDSIVTINARLRVARNDTGLSCTINVANAGEVLFYPDHIEIYGQPEAACKLDVTKFHDYQIIRDEKSLVVKIDGVERIRTNKLFRSGHAGLVTNETGSEYRRPWGLDRMAFGTTFRSFSHIDDNLKDRSIWRWDNFHRRTVVGQGESYWQWLNITVKNKTTPDLSWNWDASSGEYPDQYQRDNIVEVDWDPQADFGGSTWVQFPDGEIFCAYYTAEETGHQRPYIKGCYLKPSDFRADPIVPDH